MMQPALGPHPDGDVGVLRRIRGRWFSLLFTKMQMYWLSFVVSFFFLSMDSNVVSVAAFLPTNSKSSVHSTGSVLSAANAMPFAPDITNRNNAALLEWTNNQNKNDQSSSSSLRQTIDPVDGSVTLHSTIPSGFAIVDHDIYEGKKIIATRPFKEGDLMYTGQALMLDLSDNDSKFKLRLYDPEDHRLLSEFDNSSTHSVDDHAPDSKLGTASKRQVYGWDGFMNHSCEPNSYFPLLSRTPHDMFYKAIAIRDISFGEEITCDYALFDYECNGHEIEVCACGASKCRGKMLGFQGLTIEDKVSILHMVEDEIRDKFFSSNDIYLLRSTTPTGVKLVMQEGDNHLIATKRFTKGEKIFTNRATILSKDDALDEKTYVLEVDGQYVILTPEHHFIHRQTYVEAVGFDSFMDHSCEPNTNQHYISQVEYESFAERDIYPGEKITCDYTRLSNDSMGLPNMGTSSFQCKCGSSKCKGTLVC